MPIRRRKRCVVIEGIEVRGDDEFCARTEESLGLLKQSPGFVLVQENVGVILQGKRSGMKPWRQQPTFTAGRPTWSYSPLWYAGAIAHDAFHARLYRASTNSNGGGKPAANAWTGIAAEKKCLAFQYDVLSALNADDYILDYIARCAGNPSYAGRTRGLGSYLDYFHRWW